MATRDEQHSTRGRADVLRLTMAGRLGESGLGDHGVYETLDLCLECRACKAECPVGVDVARFKSEFLADYWRRHGSRARSAGARKRSDRGALGKLPRPALQLDRQHSACQAHQRADCSASTAAAGCPRFRRRTLERLASRRSEGRGGAHR